ncbi:MULTISPECIES: OsmC family protein [unclassified Desulfovibrio]|uniref:OsmC family protein n=1 Tax=unclassified Desulfovibrio TaxID=2593640 RepID=UPI002FD88799
MSTVSAKYLGDLRVECVHNQRGAKIITDAPSDNQGKGESFSPTDLCATPWGLALWPSRAVTLKITAWM